MTEPNTDTERDWNDLRDYKTALPDYMRCPHCGIEVANPRKKRCRKCGRAYTAWPSKHWLVALVEAGLALLASLVLFMISKSTENDSDRFLVTAMVLGGFGALAIIPALLLRRGGNSAWHFWTTIVAMGIAVAVMFMMITMDAPDLAPPWAMFVYLAFVVGIVGLLWRSNTPTGHLIWSVVLVAGTLILTVWLSVVHRDEDVAVTFPLMGAVMIYLTIVLAVSYAVGFRWYHGVRKGWTGEVPDGR